MFGNKRTTGVHTAIKDEAFINLIYNLNNINFGTFELFEVKLAVVTIATFCITVS